MSPLASTLIEAGVTLAATVIKEVAEGADDTRLRQLAAEHAVITLRHTQALAEAEATIPGFRAT